MAAPDKRPEDGRQQDAQDELPAANLSHQSVERIEQGLHRARAEHDLAHEDEERHSRERAVGRRREHTVGEHAEAGCAGQREQADQIENQEADESRQSGDEQEQQQRSAGGDRKPPCHCGTISGDGVESGSSASRRKYSALLSNP